MRRAKIYLPVFLLILPATAAAQRLPQLSSIPDTLPQAVRQNLHLDKVSLEQARSGLFARVNQHNSECSSTIAGSAKDAECREVYGSLMGELRSLAAKMKAFNTAVKRAFAEAKSKVKTAPPSSLTFMDPKEPLFSKGSKTSTPVDAREFLATTGKGFKYGQDLMDYIKKADWPMRAKSAFTLSILKANRGQYNEAINYLQEAIATAPNEPLLKNALAHVKELKAAQKAKASAGPLARETVNPDDLARFPIKVQAEVNLAAASIVVGDYDAAVKYMNEALETLPDDQGLLDGLLYVKQLKAARDERAAGPVDPDRYRAARVRAKGEAAWNLGLYLSEKSDYKATVRYLKEARSLIQDDLSTQLIGKLIANVRTLPAKPIEEFPIYPSKAEAILDALEYGKGDWGASLRYLEVAHKANPSNLPVRDALNYLQGLHGYHQFSTSR